MSWTPIVGKPFNAAEFDSYCRTLQWTSWRPSFIVLHNTGVPSLAQRPNGFNKSHMNNFVTFYRDTKHWSAGPHLFVDDHKIWVFTPLTSRGVHSPSWNSVALGIEMLGDFETEEFDTGRGKAVRDNTVAAMVTLSDVLGIDPQTMRLHREDPGTTHACPGSKVRKLAVIQLVMDGMGAHQAGDHPLDVMI